MPVQIGFGGWGFFAMPAVLGGGRLHFNCGGHPRQLLRAASCFACTERFAKNRSFYPDLISLCVPGRTHRLHRLSVHFIIWNQRCRSAMLAPANLFATLPPDLKNHGYPNERSSVGKNPGFAVVWRQRDERKRVPAAQRVGTADRTSSTEPR
jgi:hypothetical protein